MRNVIYLHLACTYCFLGSVAYANELRFVDAYQMLLTQNGEYQAQLNRYKASNADVWGARSRYLPQVRIDGNYGVTEEFLQEFDQPVKLTQAEGQSSPTKTDSSAAKGATENTNDETPLTIGGLSLTGKSVPIEDDYVKGDASIVLEQPIFNPRVTSNIRRVKSIKKESFYELSKLRESLVLQLVEAYTSALRAQDIHSITEKELEALDKHKGLTKKRHEEGVGTLTDWHESESRYQLVVADLIQSDYQINEQYSDLSRIVGQTVNKVTPLLAKFKPELPENLIEDGLNAGNTNDVLLAEQKVKTSKARVKEERAERWPSISLVGRSQFITEEQSLLTTENDNYKNSVMLQLAIPLFSGFSTVAKVKSARYQQIADEHFARDTLLSAISEAEKSHNNLITSYKRLVAFENAYQSSQQALELREKGYIEGLSSNLDLLDALRDNFRAERSYKSSIYDYITAYYHYLASSREMQDSDMLYFDSLLAP